MLEFLEIIWSILSAIIDFAFFTSVVADIIAWFKSSPNRTARQEAKKHGEVPPPRDSWSKAFWILTAVLVILLALIVVRTIKGR